jgi:mannose-6-phosphate isomerase-like protein (cupin superfamily)
MNTMKVVDVAHHVSVNGTRRTLMASQTMGKRNIGTPEETRPFDRGKMEVVKLPTATIGRATFEPGWKWSECVKPIARTDSCQVEHTGYILSGRMHVVMNDGSEMEVGPNDAFYIPPGHDAWIVGNEACVALDFTGAAAYASK